MGMLSFILTVVMIKIMIQLGYCAIAAVSPWRIPKSRTNLSIGHRRVAFLELPAVTHRQTSLSVTALLLGLV